MALVVLLRGVNVGGRRTLRPAALARELAHLGTVNIGAAGTLVVRSAVSRTLLRAEVARRLPFTAEIVICEGREMARLPSTTHFAEAPASPDIVRFVSVLARRPRSAPALPLRLPATGEWLVRLVAREGRFVFGVYRRRAEAAGALGRLEALFGVPVTTRNWNTVCAVAAALELGGARRTGRSR